MKTTTVKGKRGSRRHRSSVRLYATMLAAGALSAASLTACGSSPTSRNSAGHASASGAGQLKGTLTFSDYQFLQSGDGPRLIAALKGYEKLHPGVKISPISVSNDSYASTLDTELGAHKGPDIIGDIAANELYQFEGAHALSPITLSAADKDLSPQNSTGVIGGTRYGVIWYESEWDFLYNKALFKKAGVTRVPTSFSSFLSDCRQIKRKTGDPGFVGRNLMNEEADWFGDLTSTWITPNGGAWANAKGKFTVDSTANLKGLTEYKQTYDSGCMQTGQSSTVFRPEFEAQKIASMVDNDDAAYTYTAAPSKLTNTNMGAAPIPWGDHIGGSGFGYVAINKYAPNQALAENFVQWVMSPAGQRRLAAGEEPNQLGTTSPAAAMPQSFLSSHPWVKPFIAEAPKAPQTSTLPVQPGKTTQFQDILMPYIAKMLAGELTPAQTLKDAQAATASLGTS